ncbi:MAG: SH3 domain-containing protein [Desulfuromonadales bacterium]
MKNCWQIAGPVLIILTFWAATAGAEARYVSDQLIVSLREKPQTSAQSITYLKTDTPVEFLEDAGIFIKVRTEAGEIGYIQKDYLTAKTPKTLIIRQLQQERDRLADQVKAMTKQLSLATSRGDQTQQELVKQLAESSAQVSELERNLEENQVALTKTSQEYQALQRDTKDVVATTNERDLLRQTNQELTATVADLKVKVKDLTMSGLIKWFLAGAGVLLIGWILGRYAGGRRRARF